MAAVTLPNNGMVHLSSRYATDETFTRAQAAVNAKGIHIHAAIDHSGDAAAAGLAMRPAKLLIFGNAKAGTPLMIAAPTLAIDLPLKVLVWEDADGRTWVSYNSPEYLRQRHGVPEELMQNLAAVRAVAEEAVR